MQVSIDGTGLVRQYSDSGGLGPVDGTTIYQLDSATSTSVATAMNAGTTATLTAISAPGPDGTVSATVKQG